MSEEKNINMISKGGAVKSAPLIWNYIEYW